MRTVAALYVDTLGPYPKMPGVLPFDNRPGWDARDYDGPFPVVAHPPCGPWSKLRHLCNAETLATADCGPKAVEQVRRFGGVLEHPANSRLWSGAELPTPKVWTGGYVAALRDGRIVDAWGGYSVQVEQVDWGHVCVKPTWLYVVGVPLLLLAEGIVSRFGSGEPTHCVCTGPRQLKRLPVASKQLKRRTPPLFAEWLVSLARASRTELLKKKEGPDV